MDGGVEVLPDESVVLHVLDVVLLRHVARGQVADPIHGHDANILDGTEKILKSICFKRKRVNRNCYTLNEIRYLQTPDLSVDLISSSR